MTPLLILLIIVYVLVCLFLVLVVLLQQGKGADLAGAFGGGGSQTSFGPRTGTNIMHRMTTVSFVLFVVLSMALSVLSGKRHGRSAMDSVETAPPPVETSQPAGATEPQLSAPLEATDDGATASATVVEPTGDQAAPVAENGEPASDGTPPDTGGSE